MVVSGRDRVLLLTLPTMAFDLIIHITLGIASIYHYPLPSICLFYAIQLSRSL